MPSPARAGETYVPVAEMVDAPDLGSDASAWRFESSSGYQIYKDSWQSLVYCPCLENKFTLIGNVGSNPTLSAIFKPVRRWLPVSLQN